MTDQLRMLGRAIGREWKRILLAVILPVILASPMLAQYPSYTITFRVAGTDTVVATETIGLWAAYCGGWTVPDPARTIPADGAGTYLWFDWPGGPSSADLSERFGMPLAALCFSWTFDASSLPPGSYDADLAGAQDGEIGPGEVAHASFVVQ